MPIRVTPETYQKFKVSPVLLSPDQDTGVTGQPSGEDQEEGRETETGEGGGGEEEEGQ